MALLENAQPPVPVYDQMGTFTWLEWFRKLRDLVLTIWTDKVYDETITSVSGNVTLTDTSHTAYVTTSAVTITLPAASTARIGNEWTIIQGVEGYVDITRSGSDTINLPTSDTTIRLTQKGSSVTLRCLTTSVWGIV